MNGILLIDKAQDWTSNDVVSKLKGMLHTRRVGHSGTLDPLATGLLVVFVGRATRGVEYAESDIKRYRAGLRLGVSTDTQDITGTVLRRCEANISDDMLREALCGFLGEQEQIPPMYSAIKINGKKLYDIARSGKEVERKARNICVYRIELIGEKDGDYILDILCSKGTYIRTLCNDIGERLGCGGCMSSLRRISAGRFSLEDAHTLDELQEFADNGGVEGLLLPVDSLFADLPQVTVNEKQEGFVRVGSPFKLNTADGRYRVYSKSGEFLMVGSAQGGIMKTEKSFFEV